MKEPKAMEEIHKIREEMSKLSDEEREEDLETLPGIPFLIPKTLDLNNANTFFEYKLKNKGKTIVDGKIDDRDNLYLPDFSFYLVPVTGHPNGFMYVYLKYDKDYLYVSQDLTSDNTFDIDDWSIVYIYTEGSLKEFKIDKTSQEYGKEGFAYTKNVDYQHKVYEFKIPISEIKINDDNTIKIGFRFYGTIGDGGGPGGESGGVGGGSEGSTTGDCGDSGGGDSGDSLTAVCGDNFCGDTFCAETQETFDDFNVEGEVVYDVKGITGYAVTCVRWETENHINCPQDCGKLI